MPLNIFAVSLPHRHDSHTSVACLIDCVHMSCVCQTNGLDDDASCQHYVRAELHAVGAPGRACLIKSCADYLRP